MLRTIPPPESLCSQVLPAEEAYQPREGEYLREEVPAVVTFLISDVAAIVGSVLLSHLLLSIIGLDIAINLSRVLPLIVISIVCCFGLFGLYPGFGIHSVVELRRTCLGSSAVFAPLVVGAAFASQAIGRSTALMCAVAWLFALFSLPLGRWCVREYFSRFSWWCQPLLIFGAGRNGVSIYHFLNTNHRLGLRPLGMVDDQPPAESDEEFYLGSLAEASTLIQKHRVTNIIIAMQNGASADVTKVVQNFAHRVPHCLVVPDMAGLPSLWNGASDCAGMPGIQCKDQLLLVNRRILKLITDYSLTLILSILIAPLFVLICLLIKITSRGPVFYKQKRIGMKGHEFSVWKFRTMAPNADQLLANLLEKDPVARSEWENTMKLKVDPRITWIGRILRITSLDELPQLFNVLRGEMSLVGPRPIVDAEISRYEECLDLYKRVRPGITGLWQVSGRNNTTYAERVRLDAFYVRNWSPWLDLHILAVTVQVVLLRKGAY